MAQDAAASAVAGAHSLRQFMVKKSESEGYGPELQAIDRTACIVGYSKDDPQLEIEVDLRDAALGHPVVPNLNESMTSDRCSY